MSIEIRNVSNATVNFAEDLNRSWRFIDGITFAFSPVDGNRVWAMGIDLDYTNDDPSHGRHIYVSDDGGTTYRVRVTTRAVIRAQRGVSARARRRVELRYAWYRSEAFRT